MSCPRLKCTHDLDISKGLLKVKTAFIEQLDIYEVLLFFLAPP
jgi:hypothetical protein